MKEKVPHLPSPHCYFFSYKSCGIWSVSYVLCGFAGLQGSPTLFWKSCIDLFMSDAEPSLQLLLSLLVTEGACIV